MEDEFNIDPHTFSAIWYALEGYTVAELKGDSVKKEKNRRVY
jgi:phage terminase large subunit